jgi:hypothetical protein
VREQLAPTRGNQSPVLLVNRPVLDLAEVQKVHRGIPDKRGPIRQDNRNGIGGVAGSVQDLAVNADVFQDVGVVPGNDDVLSRRYKGREAKTMVEKREKGKHTPDTAVDRLGGIFGFPFAQIVQGRLVDNHPAAGLRDQLCYKAGVVVVMVGQEHIPYRSDRYLHDAQRPDEFPEISGIPGVNEQVAISAREQVALGDTQIDPLNFCH